MGAQCHPHETCTTTNQVSHSWVIDVLETKDMIKVISNQNHLCNSSHLKMAVKCTFQVPDRYFHLATKRSREMPGMLCQVPHSGLSQGCCFQFWGIRKKGLTGREGRGTKTPILLFFFSLLLL